MAYDSTKPAIADNYSTGYTQTIKDNFNYVLRWGEGDSVTGTTPTNAKRYNPTNDYFEYYTGSAWAILPLDYLRKTGGGEQTCTQATVFSASVSPLRVEVGGVKYAVMHYGMFNPDDKANLSGANFSGAITTTSTVTASGRVFGNGVGSNNGLGKITVQQGGSPPSGSQGDICFIY